MNGLPFLSHAYVGQKWNADGWHRDANSALRRDDISHCIQSIICLQRVWIYPMPCRTIFQRSLLDSTLFWCNRKRRFFMRFGFYSRQIIFLTSLIHKFDWEGHPIQNGCATISQVTPLNTINFCKNILPVRGPMLAWTKPYCERCQVEAHFTSSHQDLLR